MSSQTEIDTTVAVAAKLQDASAKIRTGPPNDLEEIYHPDYYASLVSTKSSLEAPVDDSRLKIGIGAPGCLE